MAQSEVVQWVNQYTDDLYKWAYHKTSNSEVAQDLVQDTFVAAVERQGSFLGNSSVKTWLFSILNNKIVDFYRKKTKSNVSFDESYLSVFFDDDGGWKKDSMPKHWDDDEGSLLDDKEFYKVLQKCLDALPESWNTIVKLKYLMQKKGDDICKELDITPSNYWQMIHRAKLQLRACIEKKWFGDK